MRQIDLNSILRAACHVAGCSVAKAKGRCRRMPCMTARYLYFALAVEKGERRFKAAWHINRTSATAIYYSKVTKRRMAHDDFTELLNKTRIYYEKSI